MAHVFPDARRLRFGVECLACLPLSIVMLRASFCRALQTGSVVARCVHQRQEHCGFHAKEALEPNTLLVTHSSDMVSSASLIKLKSSEAQVSMRHV